MIYNTPRYTSTLKLHEDTNTALLEDRYKLLTKSFHDRVKQVDNPLIQLLGTYQVVQDPRKRMPLHTLIRPSTLQIFPGSALPPFACQQVFQLLLPQVLR